MVLRTICPTDKILAAKDADIITTRTGRLFPPRMLDVTNALNKLTLRNVVVPEEYEIKLLEEVTPFNLTTPRRIPIPLLPRVLAE